MQDLEVPVTPVEHTERVVAQQVKNSRQTKNSHVPPLVKTVTFKRSKEGNRRVAEYVRSSIKLVQPKEEKPSEPVKEKIERKKQFTKQELCDACLIYYSSPKTYKILRKKQLMSRLPSPRTIMYHIQGYSCAPGLGMELFELLKLRLESFEDLDKNVSLW